VNLSDDLLKAGQRESARRAIAEAVARYREMSQVNPAAFQADYGKALFNFGTLLAKTRCYQDAYAAMSEALSVFQGEHIDDPVSNRLMLALTQATIAALLIDLDDPGAAAAHAREAITLIRKHGPAGSVTIRERIARAVGHLALQLGAGQIWGGALESADLCSRMFLKLAADDPSLAGYAKYAVGIPLAIRAAMADPQLQGRMRALSRERGRDKPPAIPTRRKKPKPKKKRRR
jgi:tetratricopeptide (TPR) repeat protein